MAKFTIPGHARLNKDLGLGAHGKPLRKGYSGELVGVDAATQQLRIIYSCDGSREALVSPDDLEPMEHSLINAEMGQKVRARMRVYDLPSRDYGPGENDIIRAEPGDIGEIVHTEEGIWPTAMFERGATMVNDDECELITEPT